MSLIACIDNCVYQQDGYCSLMRAGSCGRPSKKNSCVNYVPRNGKQSQDGAEHLANITYPDEL